MAGVLRLPLAAAARIAGKHLSGQQTEILFILQSIGGCVYLRQSLRQKQGHGRSLLRAYPLAGQLFVVANRQPRGELSLHELRGRIHRAGVDGHLARTYVLQRFGEGARL